MTQPSGLVRKLHRRGKRRRDRIRLAVRVTVSLLVLAAAAALSAGVVHVVERPVPPFETLAANLAAENLEASRSGAAKATHNIDDYFWEKLGGQGKIKSKEEAGEWPSRPQRRDDREPA